MEAPAEREAVVPANMTIRRRVTRVVSAVCPSLGWRVRNAAALARWAGDSLLSGDESPDAYADAFWDEYPAGDWAGLSALVLRYCAPRSLVDLGCGDGRLLGAFRSSDARLEILGIDGSPAAVRRARTRGLPVEQHDLFSWRLRRRKQLESRLAGFDVTVSLETAEHLPPWSSTYLTRILTQGRLAVFSAAIPGQGGTLHMNERPFEYWRRRFSAHGFEPAGFDCEFRDAVRRLDLPWWYARNIHVFERGA
jgi:SAM-dependent methyltransferase